MKKGWGSNQKGFTLVELLVVVAIIGILVAIAVPNLLDAIDRSKQRATVAEMRLWAISLQEYSHNSVLILRQAEHRFRSLKL